MNAKDTLRSVPDGGMGYGFVDHTDVPDICFNYLGDFGKGHVSYVKEYSTGADSAYENKTDDKIVINGQVSNGELKFVISSSVNEYGQEFIQRLSDEFKQSVTELAEYCAGSSVTEKTSSDLTDNIFDDSDLSLLDELI